MNVAGIDARNRAREDLTILAEVRLDGESSAHMIKVRNLSPAGVMGEGDLRVMRGSRIEICMRGMPPVAGSVAWVEGERFGVAFLEELEPHHISQINAQAEAGLDGDNSGQSASVSR